MCPSFNLSIRKNIQFYSSLMSIFLQNFMLFLWSIKKKYWIQSRFEPTNQAWNVKKLEDDKMKNSSIHIHNFFHNLTNIFQEKCLHDHGVFHVCLKYIFGKKNNFVYLTTNGLPQYNKVLPNTAVFLFKICQKERGGICGQYFV